MQGNSSSFPLFATDSVADNPHSDGFYRLPAVSAGPTMRHNDPMEDPLHLADEVADALAAGRPVVALESPIIAHGMPYPQNVEFALDAQRLVRQAGALPAIIAILNGKICVGLNETQLSRITDGKDVQKTSVRDIRLYWQVVLPAQQPFRLP